jgi:uncharacterized metal-binding protein YceD (DUF177 family)
VERELVSLARIVEDEVLLALPIVPKHALSECAVGGVRADLPVELGSAGEEHPFAVLARLRKTTTRLS